MNPSTYARVAPPVDQPTPTLWCGEGRGSEESALDTETAVRLNCIVGRIFEAAADWSQLVRGLSAYGFSLQFEGSRLVLFNDQTGHGLCTCASLGHSFRALLARLGKPAVLADSGRLIPRPAR
ncbi:hypothetical protein [Seohaeicola zhoushanensis]|nr:hypothetical protein [Seohaeicola zhoushanensis]